MKLPLFLVFLFIFFQSQGQICTTPDPTPEQLKYIKKIINEFDPSRDYNGELPIVRLSLNRVSRDDGTGGFSWVEIDNVVSGMSTLYDNLICFTVIERNEIDDTNLFGAPAPGALYDQLILTNPTTEAIRIYLVNDGDSGGRATGPVITPVIEEQTDVEEVTNDPTVYLSDWTGGLFTFTSEVLAHEIGHCLGLWHTHTEINGIENVARNGVNANCDVNGDLLCDTPADPNLEFLLNPLTGDVPSCSYFGAQADPDPVGAIYTPLTNNIMSYTHPTCMTSLTTGQIDRCLDFITQTELLDDIIIPENINIEGSISDDRYYHADETIISTAIHSSGLVDYRARETITLSPGFSVIASTTTELSAKIDNNLCHDELIANSGFIGNEIEERSSASAHKHLMLFPNHAADQITVRLGDSLFDYQTVVLTNMQGERLEFFATEIVDNQFTVDISGLNQGIYLVTVIQDNYQESIKFVKM